MTDEKTSGLRVAILTRDRVERCRACVKHAAGELKGVPGSEILIINNGGMAVNAGDYVDGVPCREINTGRNLGVVARNIAINDFGGDILVLIDDDVYPVKGCLREVVGIFNADKSTGAVAFRINNGREDESCLLPTVFHGSAVAFRTGAIQKIGGYPGDFLYYGEEYDLALRLYQAGFGISMGSKAVSAYHARDLSGRSIDRIIRLLMRNNARLWASYLPRNLLGKALRDVFQRYWLVSLKEKSIKGFLQGCLLVPGSVMRGRKLSRPLKPEILGRVIMIEQLQQFCTKAGTDCPRDVVLCGTGRFPRIWAEALVRNGFRVGGILDTNACWRGKRIDGIPVLISGDSDANDILGGNGNTFVFLTGLSSLTETRYWAGTLSGRSFRRIYGATPEESSAQTGIIDLLRDLRISAYIHK